MPAGSTLRCMALRFPQVALTALVALAPLALACSSDGTDAGGAGSAGQTSSVAGAPGAAGKPSTSAGAPGVAGMPGTAGASSFPGTAGAPSGGGPATGAAGATPGAGGGPTGAGGSAPVGSSVEDDGVDCDVGTIPSPAANTKLPDPFKNAAGTRITKKSDWRCQRRYLRKVMEKYVYGEKPPKPATVTGTVSKTSITVNVSDNGKTAMFTASVSAPTTGAAPYPAIISYGASSLDKNLILGLGVAIIQFDPYQAGKEGTGRANKAGAFYTIHGTTHAKSGLLVAWAWGVSRILDVLEADGDKAFESSAIGVTGCSRFGKGSFVAGAFDQRIALGIPFESGTAGVPIFRGIGKLESAQTLSSAYGEQPWFGDDFSPFQSAPTTLPLDTHATIGMYAPRGLIILDNPHIANLGPKSASVAALAGAEIYKALGAQDNLSYISDIQNGDHCSWRTEFNAPLTAAIQKHLLKSGTTAGKIAISSKASSPLADWKDWETPTLQ